MKLFCKDTLFVANGIVKNNFFKRDFKYGVNPDVEISFWC